jgi:hypothetical protein
MFSPPGKELDLLTVPTEQTPHDPLILNLWLMTHQIQITNKMVCNKHYTSDNLHSTVNNFVDWLHSGAVMHYGRYVEP